MKRIIDILVSAIGLIILSPLLLIVTILVRIKLGSPILFKQQRPGLNCRLFTMFKFRTMISTTHDAQGNQLPDNRRLTPFGLWLRATSLDELPELLNVLGGQMSLVGPRPLMVKYLGRYTPEQNRRHEVKPGITGWAQINYGYGATIEDATEKLNYELFYIKNMSIWMDLMIVLRTVKIVLFGRGAR